MLAQLKTDRIAQLMLAGIALVSCLLCVSMSVWVYRTRLPSSSPSPGEKEYVLVDESNSVPANTPWPPVSPSPGEEYVLVDESNPTPVNTPWQPPAPSQPTATPPGEEITGPNYLAGKTAYQVKNYTEVLRLMKLVLAANPRLAPAHWYNGMAYFYQNNYEAGLAEMEQALALDPNYALGYADRGLLHSRLGHTEQALADWQKALALDPTLAKVHHNLGTFYQQQGDYTRALQEIDLALTIDPTRAVTRAQRGGTLMEMGQYQAGLAEANQAIQMKADEWLAYYVRGTCNAQMGRFEEGVADLTVYVQKVPTDAQGWYNRGLAYRLQKGPITDEQALADYSQAIQLNPQFAWALTNRGNIYLQRGQLEQALADYNRALAIQEIPLARKGRGDVYYQLKRYEEAQADYERAGEVSPGYDKAKNGVILTNIRMAEQYLAQKDYQRAIDTAKMVVADPGDYDVAVAYRIIGKAYYGLGDNVEAILNLTQAIKRGPLISDYYHRGVALVANNQPDDAIRDFQFVIVQGSSLVSQDDPGVVEAAKAKLAELQP